MITATHLLKLSLPDQPLRRIELSLCRRVLRVEFERMLKVGDGKLRLERLQMADGASVGRSKEVKIDTVV